MLKSYSFLLVQTPSMLCSSDYCTYFPVPQYPMSHDPPQLHSHVFLELLLLLYEYYYSEISNVVYFSQWAILHTQLNLDVASIVGHAS